MQNNPFKWAIAVLAAAQATLPLSASAQAYEFRMSMAGFQVAPPVDQPAVPGPAVALDRAAIDFGAQAVPGTSVARTLTVTNTGNVTLGYLAPQLSGPFMASSSCPASLAPGSSCSIVVTFQPNTVGQVSGSLTARFGLLEKVVTLTGTGQGAATADLSALSLDFGSTLVGSSSARTVRLTNNGTTSLELLSAPELTGAFAFSFPVSGATNCGASLAVNGYCDTTVVFTPLNALPEAGTLSFVTSVGVKTAELQGSAFLPASSLLVHFDNNLTDVFGHSVATSSGVTFNAVNAWAGGAALSFNGTDSKLAYTSGDTDFRMGTGDFTLEARVRPSSYTGGIYGRTIFDLRPNEVNGTYPFLGLARPGGGLQVIINNAVIATAASPVAIGQWSHVAWSRNAGVSRLYVNGTEVASFADSNDYGNPGTVKVGSNAFSATAPSTCFHGLIDEARITKGLGRYPSSFTPAGTAFADY